MGQISQLKGFAYQVRSIPEKAFEAEDFGADFNEFDDDIDVDYETDFEKFKSKHKK